MKNTKTLLLAAASALALSTVSVFAADEVVAKVNGKEITTADLKQLESSLPPEMIKRAQQKGDIKEELTNQLVDFRVITDAALKSDVAKTKEVQQAIERAKEQVIVQAFVFEQLKSKVNDQAIEQEYKTLKDKFMKEVKDKKEIKVRHILFKDEKDANAALKRLKNGEDFQKLARELSEDKQSGQDGGDLGYILEGTVPEFDAALKNLKSGDSSKEATKTNFGYHLFKVDDRRSAKPPKFEDVKAQLGARVQQKAFLELVKRLRDKASVEIIATTEVKK
ncbi:MAG: peptidylprolyl isomerase [Alphaproteobacteria bacterium]|nr:peptidylprolyl isomerase [Alphaproteobacteria bacterium]